MNRLAADATTSVTSSVVATIYTGVYSWPP